MSRNPEDIINFAAGPAKLPREVRDAVFLFSDPLYFITTGYSKSSNSSFELGRNWYWSDG